MKTYKVALGLVLLALLPRFALAALVGPYTVDTNTLILLHLDEAAGGSVTTNVGLLGGNFITCDLADNNPSPPVTTMLGFPSYSTNDPTASPPIAVSFDNCESNTTAGYGLGYCFNGVDTAFYGDTGSATTPGPSNDYMYMTNLNIGNGGQTPFTLEALICPTSTAGNQDIISTDNHNSNRPFFFRISGGTLAFQFVAVSGATLSANIPTLAQDPENGFVPNTWYHVAFTYDGTNATLYWTKLDPSLGAAHVLGTTTMALGTAAGADSGPLSIGNRSRTSTAGSETFLGAIDEVRISNVCRAANQMQFYSPEVTINQNPVSQNVDYNDPVTFTVGASSQSPLAYQWLFNSNSITGATNSSYVIPNVASGNAGYYEVIVTNTLGYAATSSPALLVVGAANFLNHRYSFLTSYTNLATGQICTPDSIAGDDGTNIGDAFETNGQLVLDGNSSGNSSGTYLQLPSGMINGNQQTAVTFEFWAAFGSNPANVYAFNFGNINNVVGVDTAHAFLDYSPNNASGQEMFISPADFQFAQTLTAPGVLDGETVHVDCIFDAPDGTMSIYTNGVLEASGPDTVGLGNINDIYSYIGASLNGGDPYLTANIEEFRIYNGALSPLSIAQSDVLGPREVLSTGPAQFIVQPTNTSVVTGWPVSFTAAANGYLPINYQWFRNGVLIPGATNTVYSFTTTSADNGATFYCDATNTIGNTTYVTNSQTATLTVPPVPPTLSWLGPNDGGADNNWNTTSLDWTNDASGGGKTTFAQFDGVLFDDRSGGSSVDLEQSILPYVITVNAASGYSFTSVSQEGSLNGFGYLNKLNSGTLIIDLTNNMSGRTTISGGDLQIGNYDSVGTLGSGPVTNNAALTFARADNALVVPNAIHGSGTVSFVGGGDVTVSGNSDYSGNTLINSGIVYLQSGTGLGDGSATVANGAQLYITGNVNLNEPLTINGVGDGNGALRKGGASLTVEQAPVTMASDSTIGVDGGATLAVSNTISGDNNLTVSGSGTLSLNSNDSLASVTLNGANIIDANAPNALGSGPITVNGDSYLVIGTGLTVTNAVTAYTVSPGVGLGVVMVNDNTNGTITTISGPLDFEASPASGGDFVGPTSSGYLNITGPVTNLATGTINSRSGFVRFSGGGNYTLFDFGAGTVSLGADDGLCTNATMVVGISGNATFDLNGFSQALAGLSDGGTFTELVTNSAVSPSTLFLNLTGESTFSNIIGGNVSVVENGSGNLLQLFGANTYTGNTTVNSGTLELAYPALYNRSTVTVASGATLQMDFNVTNTIGNLVLNRVSQPAGVYSSATSPSYLAGPGSLLVVHTVLPNVAPHITGFSLSGGNLSVTATNGVNGGTYYLLGATNVATPINQWTALATNVVNASGSAETFSFVGTNVYTVGSPHWFFILSSTNN